MVRNFLIAALVAGIAATGLSAAADKYVKIKITHGDALIELKDVEINNTSVCVLKERIAKLIGLKKTKFHLQRNGRTLKGDKTPSEEHIFYNSMLTIKPVARSWQCS